ncbi:MAG: hypothetical protein V7606_4606, partial [Burkholderiales bacterium]
MKLFSFFRRTLLLSGIGLVLAAGSPASAAPIQVALGDTISV